MLTDKDYNLIYITNRLSYNERMMLHEQVEQIVGNSNASGAVSANYLRYREFLRKAEEKGLVRKAQFTIPIHPIPLNDFLEKQAANAMAQSSFVASSNI